MRSPSKTKRSILAALAAIGVTAGGAGLASAATGQSIPPHTQPVGASTATSDVSGAGDQADTTGGDSNTPSYHSSVTIPATSGSADARDNETADAATLAPLAKVTPAEAVSAATATVPGSANTPQLEDENGNVVYGIVVTTADGRKVDVKVDAGTGTVVHQESDNESGNHDESNDKGTESATETNDGNAK